MLKIIIIDLPNTPNFANDTFLRLFRYWATQSEIIGLQSTTVKEGCNSYHFTKMWLIIWDGMSYSPGHTAKYRSYSLMDLAMRQIFDIQQVQVRMYGIHFFCFWSQYDATKTTQNDALISREVRYSRAGGKGNIVLRR